SHAKKPVMPPRSENNDLTEPEIAILKRWIEEGVKGPAGPDVKVRPKVALTFPPAIVRPVRALAISPDGKTVAAARGNTLHIYDGKTGAYQRTLADPALKTAEGKVANAAHLSLIESMALSQDGKTLATGSFQEVILWNLADGTIRTRLAGFAHNVVGLVYSPDGKTLATAGGAPTEDGEVRLHDATTGALLRELKSPHSDTVFGLHFSPDGKLLATSGADKFVKVFEVATGTFQKSFEGHTQHVLDVAWTPDGKKIVSAGADNGIKVWDYEKGEKARDINGQGKQVTRLLMLAKKPEFLATCGDGNVKLVNAESGGNIRNYAGATDFVYAVAATADASIVVAGGEDGIARLYGSGGQLVKALEPPATK
ncbi:MAG: WD40 repeat domain-containing protein, partial [Gemmataceae bacterium]